MLQNTPYFWNKKTNLWVPTCEIRKRTSELVTEKSLFQLWSNYMWSHTENMVLNWIFLRLLHKGWIIYYSKKIYSRRDALFKRWFQTFSHTKSYLRCLLIDFVTYAISPFQWVSCWVKSSLFVECLLQMGV